MSRSRLELHEKLKELLGSDNVYFSPPESVKMKFPCIVYELDPYQTDNADNRIYFIHKKYSLTYISKDPDAGEFKEAPRYEEKDAKNVIEDILFAFAPYARHDRRFISDNLMHDAFTIYF